MGLIRLPVKASTFSLRLVNKGFIRALVAYADGFSTEVPPTKEQRTLAAFAQRYFRLLGLHPSPRPPPTQEQAEALVKIWRKRVEIMKDAKASELDPSRPREYDAQKVADAMNSPECAPGVRYLADAFGRTDRSGPTDMVGRRIPIPVSASLKGMSGRGRTAYENCNNLQEAISLMQDEMAKADVQSIRMGERPAYQEVGLLKPVDVDTIQEYDDITAVMEAGKPANIYEAPTAPFATLPEAERYGTTPRETGRADALGI